MYLEMNKERTASVGTEQSIDHTHFITTYLQSNSYGQFVQDLHIMQREVFVGSLCSAMCNIVPMPD